MSHAGGVCSRSWCLQLCNLGFEDFQQTIFGFVYNLLVLGPTWTFLVFFNSKNTQKSTDCLLCVCFPSVVQGDAPEVSAADCASKCVQRADMLVTWWMFFFLGLDGDWMVFWYGFLKWFFGSFSKASFLRGLAGFRLVLGDFGWFEGPVFPLPFWTTGFREHFPLYQYSSQ